MIEETLYSVNQVALLLKVHTLTIRRYIKEGKLRAIKIAGNIRISQTALNNFSADVQPTSYGLPKNPKPKVEQQFNLDDPIFRLRGRGMSLKTI